MKNRISHSAERRPGRNWAFFGLLCLFVVALFNAGCANDAFLPPPETRPYGQDSEEAETPHLEPPSDL